MQRKPIVVVALALASAVGLRAIPVLGAGLPVFDGTAFVEMLMQTTHMLSQVKQLVQTYQKITQQYDQMVYQAKALKNMKRYQIPNTIWKGIKVQTDTYGRVGRWANAVNNGSDAAGSWVYATQQIGSYNRPLPISQRDRIIQELSGIELADATAVGSIDTIGRVRASGPEIEKILAVLEADAVSTDPDLQTAAAQRNHTNALSLVQAKALADSNKLAVSIAEMNLIQMRREREATARALAIDVAVRNSTAASVADISSEIRGFRMP